MPVTCNFKNETGECLLAVGISAKEVRLEGLHAWVHALLHGAVYDTCAEDECVFQKILKAVM